MRPRRSDARMNGVDADGSSPGRARHCDRGAVSPQRTTGSRPVRTRPGKVGERRDDPGARIFRAVAVIAPREVTAHRPEAGVEPR